MSLVVAWLAFPLLVGALAFGCGLLVTRLSGLALPGALVPPLGLATIMVAAQFATSFDATAELTTPLIVALAVAGLFSARRDFRTSVPSRAELAAALSVFVVFAIPVVALGEATIAGYMKLEDGSTFLALADNALDHGRGARGYADSEYLILNNRGDYPVGSLLPFGIGGRILREEIAWLLQPYLAFLAAMLALVLQPLCASLITSPWRRALVGFIAAQAALLFGFAMWGGTKELTAAWLIPLAATLLPVTARATGWRAQLPLAVTTAAAVTALSFGGLAWLGFPFAVTLALLGRSDGFWIAAKRAAAFVLVSVPLLVPALPTAELVTYSGNRAVLTSQQELGTLPGPLNNLEVVGVWLGSDFRFSPDYDLATLALIVLVVSAAIAGAWQFWRGEGRAALLYALGAATGCIAIVSGAGPWFDAKALATVSPVLVFLAMSAGVHATEAGRRLAGWIVIVLVGGGVLASNAMAYREVTLAPRDRFEELIDIDRDFAGMGPTLLTREEAYANRYFLRDMAVDNAAEKRWHRPIKLRDGRDIPTFRSVDIDQLSIDTIEHFRLLVLRRSPVGSRPPSNFELAWRGRWYDVWRRAAPAPVAHLGFGDRFDPGDTPSCMTLRGFAADHERLLLAAAHAPSSVVVKLPPERLPGGWQPNRQFPGAASASRSGTVDTTFELPHGGRWQLWVGGAVLGHLSLTIDGRRVATMRHRMNHRGDYEPLAVVALSSGRHRLGFDYTERLVDGINDRFLMGPVALSPAGPPVEPAVLPAGDVDSLCGERLDWVEAIPRP